MTNLPTAAGLWVDLSGLPSDALVQVMKIIDEAERMKAKAAGIPVVEPDETGRFPLAGRYQHLKAGASFTQEMFDEARREAWANFPREFPDPNTP